MKETVFQKRRRFLMEKAIDGEAPLGRDYHLKLLRRAIIDFLRKV